MSSFGPLQLITAHGFTSYAIMKQCAFINTQLSAKHVIDRIWIHVFLFQALENETIIIMKELMHTYLPTNISYGLVLWPYSYYVLFYNDTPCGPFANESRQPTLDVGIELPLFSGVINGVM